MANQHHCRFCGERIPMHLSSDWFLRRKREDSQFCSPKCRTDCNNTRRKLARKVAALKRLEIEIFELNRLLAWDYKDVE